MKLEKIVLFNCAILFTVFWFIRLPLSPDEAHYYLWSLNLDWSYYSKGPLLGLVIKLSTLLFGKSEHSVRLPALLFSFGSIALVYRYLTRHKEFVDTEKLYLIIFSSVAMWYQALVMTTDAPAIFFWLLSCIAFKNYLDSDKNVYSLIVGSIALGFGIWSKYTILVVFVVFSVFLLKRVFQRQSPVRHLCLYFGIIALFVLPIIYWNYLNGWVNFQHNATHVGSGKINGLKPFYFFDFIGGQIGMFGLFLVTIVVYAARFFNRRSTQGTSFIFLSALSLFLVCMFVSFFKRIYPNWTIPAYPLMVLSLGLALNTHFLMNKKIFNIFLGVNAFVSLLGVLLLFGFTFALPGRILPTKKMVGWRDFSSFVLDQKLSNPDIGFVISESYDFTSELNFYTPSLNVYNTTLGGRRMNQFDIWQSHSDRLKEIRGSSVLLVLSSPEASDLFKPYFSRIERLPVKKDFSYDFSGESLRTVYLFRGYDYNGKPFQNAESH